MLGNLIGGFIVIVVGVNLLPTIADQIYLLDHNRTGGTARLTANLSTASLTVAKLVTLFYCLGIMSAGVAITVGGLRNAGVM